MYIEAGYPQETLESLAKLESSTEYLVELLESYRYLQPDGKLFSVTSIAKIYQLQELEYLVASHTEELEYHERMIDRYNHEINCIENGQEIMNQSSVEAIF